MSKNGAKLVSRLVFVIVPLCLMICSITGSFLVNFTSGGPTSGFYYKIKVKEGDWVEYVVTEVIEKAIIPIEFKDSFPKNWTSVNEGSLIRVDVLEKVDIDFGNYSREFAVFNVTFNSHHLIPFWFYETIQSIQQLPFDGFSFFLPVNQSYWEFLENQVEWLADKVKEHEVQITYDVRNCFYRLRIDSLFFGWVEVSASYDDYFGVLSDFSVMFLFSSEFVNEIQRHVGTIIVDGQPFQIEPSKKYGVKISLSDSNIPQLINSIEYGQNFADALTQAIENGEVGAIITIKSSSESNKITSRINVVVDQLSASANATSNKITIEVHSTPSKGKVLLVNIHKDVFQVQWTDEFQVLVDNEPIAVASNYNDVLNPFNDEGAEYYVIIGSKLTQVAISIPSFSTHKIEIIKVPSLTAKLIFYSTVGGVICLAIIGVYLLRRRIKHRNER
ncbi:hypothetical protein J7K06_01275 [Candidatus Bathyarchaeota archaeon]|nr:hypothetical protein [Candidatus Bathyarchaeota archaeon]